MIRNNDNATFWNYFLAIEDNFATVARYIEFSESNFGTYSIELAHVLLSTSSEIDVMLKMLCNLVDPQGKFENIDDYRKILVLAVKDFSSEVVYIPRFSIMSTPWKEWGEAKNPPWWRSYNDVKHERNLHYKKANLGNCIDSISGLYVTLLYFYKYYFSSRLKKEISLTETMNSLLPESSFFRMKSEYYYGVLTK